MTAATAVPVMSRYRGNTERRDELSADVVEADARHGDDRDHRRVAEQCRALRGRCHEIGRGLRRDRRCGLEGSLAARIDAELSPLVRFGGIEAQREHDLLHEIGVHPTAARAEDVVDR
ncbi:hypothetical protein MN032_18535 [Agromyces atrinae]|uniref:hypothetical protein n=1 Tax=Agromyces atrinae TaxID=592376 RepID=UPI001F5857AE|nr:hypothetical protein [Agromyces atrinae]MCI2959685.1 hypothetical protein [Agromyces atrinae]